MADQGGEQAPPVLAGEGDRFQWHPTYKGRTYADVRQELATEIARDQRAYNLAMEGAEADEHDSLSSVIDLDRKWSDFDLGWAEADPDELAGRILGFEAERDRRRQLMPWREYQAADLPVTNRMAASAGVAGMPWLWVIIAIIVLIIIVIVLVTVL
jgi:hypothetical protein